MALYEDVIFLQGQDYDEFEKECTADDGYIDPDKALEYLAQWYYGEPNDSRTTDPNLCGFWICVNHAQNDHFLAKWCGLHAIAALWLIVRK